MNLGLKEKVIIVTGGAKGIGEGISESLALESAMVAIVGRNEVDNLKCIEKIQAIGGQAFSFVAELSDPNQCKKVIEEIYTKFERIDGLVNNAGINDGVGLANGTYEKSIQSLHSNLIHYYLLAQACLPHLIKTKGSIVNIGSKVAETGQGGTSAYAASNGGRNALTREWAVELLPHGIRVNCVCPGFVATPMQDRELSWEAQLRGTDPETIKKLWINDTPLGRLETPEDVAKVVAFLAGSDADFITGEAISVNGGAYMD